MNARWLTLAAGLTFSVVLSGQVRLAGRVNTDTNAPVANAVVAVRSAAPGATRFRTFADAAGEFTFSLPAPGNYLLDVEASGFFRLKDRPVAVSDNAADLTVVLSPVREFADSVDVTASSSTTSLDQVATGHVLTGTEMMNVPFPVTHNLKAAMRAVPGVVQDGSNGIHLNGGAERQALYLLDGFNVGNPLTGEFDTRVSVEAIQSMKVESGALPAEYGKGSAGVIAVQTNTGDDRLRYSATNFVPGVEFNKGMRIGSWNPRVNVSGPLRRGRIWFSDSIAGQYNQMVVKELPRGQDLSTSYRYTNFARVQANLTPSNIASFGFLASAWTSGKNGLSALDPAETTVNRKARQWFIYGKDQMYFGHGAVAEFGFASNRNYSRESPQGHALYIVTPYGRRGNFFVDGHQESDRNQAQASAYLPSFEWMGSHQLKVGSDIDWLTYGQDVRRTGYEWLNANLSPIRRVVFEGNGDVNRNNTEASAYVQDSWRVRPNVLFEVGLRSDWDRILGNWTASPRVGVAWSPKALDTTRVSAGYAISYDATNLQLFTRPFDQYPITYYYPPYGFSALPVRSVYTLGQRGFASPRFTTWNAAIDHRFGSNLFARVQALRRRGSDGLTFIGPAAIAPSNEAIYRLSNSRADSYDSVELTVRQNFHREYGWLASYTRSRASSTAVMDLASDTPLLVDENSGRLPWDSPNRFLTWGYLPTFWDKWSIAYLLEYRDGFPFSIENNAGQVIGPVNSARYPEFFELNFHVERQFDFRGQRWAGRAGFTNITNHRNPNTVNNIMESPEFLSYYGGQSRALQFRIRWLGKL